MKHWINSGILFLLLQVVIITPVFAGGNPEKNRQPETKNQQTAGQLEQSTGENTFPPVDVTQDQFPHKIETLYADGFSVEYHNTYKIVRVLEPYPNAQRSFQYVLAQRGAPIPEGYADATVIPIPVRSFVSLSSSYLGGLSMLGEMDTLTGVDRRKNVYSSTIRERIQAYEVLEVSNNYRPNIELLLEIDPDCIMASALGNEMDVHPKLLEVNLPIVINGEWNEEHPLGRAEWIKFLSLFYNKEQQAEELFSTIEQQYLAIRQAAQAREKYPTVFSGAPFDDVWYMPGGESFTAQFFEDAGADYIWSETIATGSLSLSFETVFYKAEDADFWLNAGWEHKSLDEMLKSDERFSNFKAFRTGQVYANNKRVAPEGGNDYWESGILNPHVVLADLVKILYPEILPEHELFYYQKLE